MKENGFITTIWNGFSHLSLKLKSILIFTIVVILPLATLGPYMLFETNQLLKEQAFNYTEQILDTTSDNLTAKMENVEDISNYIIYSDKFRAYLKYPVKGKSKIYPEDLEEDLKGYLTFQLMGKSYINSITIDGVNGTSLHMGEPIKAKEDHWKYLAEIGAGAIVWTNAYPVYSYWNGEEHAISMFRVINDIDHMNNKIGLIRIRLNEPEIERIINSGITDVQGTTFILRDNGQVVLSDNKKQNGRFYPDQTLLNKIKADHLKQKNFYYSVDGKDYLVATKKIQGTDWRLVTMLSEKAVIKELVDTHSLVLVSIIFIILLGILILVGFYLTIVRPILDLTEKTKRVEQGDFSVYVKVTSNDEIGQLAHRFNQMVARIQKLINTKYKLEIKQRESDLKNLQSQINPHFLYNTLDMIRWTARMEKAFETSRLIELLSKMFRISLSKGDIWIPLQKELEYVESYIELQKKRMGDKLDYHIKVEPCIKEVFVLKQIIQPLVENSILHGFKGIKQTGQIDIDCYASKDVVYVDVVDNGHGVDIDEINQLILGKAVQNDTKGFALNNINDRLTTAFGLRYGLTFKDKEGGAWARITLPLLKSENDIKKLSESLGENQ